MRILFLAQLLPFPLDAGPKIRAYYVLRHLAEAGHDVTLVCFVRPTDSPGNIPALGRFCRRVETVPIVRSRFRDARDGLHSLLSRTPFLILRDQVPEMTRRLATVVDGRSYDAAHADQLWMAPYVAGHPGFALRVLDQHNAVFRVPQRLAEHARNPVFKAVIRQEAVKLARFEREVLDAFHTVTWVARADRDAFQLTDCARHPVIPIAVDPTDRVKLTRPDPFRVTFLGGAHWPPNAEGIRWFAERVWPRVAAAAPRAVATVIGKSGGASLGRRVVGEERFEVTGYVADLEPYLRETAVFVVPLQSGAGMRVKILDAWSWGLPVVSTTVGAEGIEATDGENVLVADEGEAFADAVLRVLNDRRLAAALGDHGRATVEACYDWRKVYAAWNRVYA